MHAKLRIGNASRHGAWPGFETTHPATLQRHSAAGVEGAGGICRGARGRRRGLAGLRDDAPNHTSAPQPHWCGGRRRDLLRCPWAVAGPGRDSRRRAEPKARSADGSRAGLHPPAHTAARPNKRNHMAPGTPADVETQRPKHRRTSRRGAWNASDTTSNKRRRAATSQSQPGKTKTADPEGSAVSSCARGELNPHSITGTRT